MKKIKLSRFIILLSFSIFVLAAYSHLAAAQYKELMYDEVHKHNDNFSMDGRLFKVKAGGTPTKVIITINNEVVVIENGTCVDKMNMSLCLTGVDFPDVELHKIYDPKDYDFHIKIWYYLANLVIEKDIEKTEFLVGEKVKVEVIIQNNGSLPAKGIYFRDIYFSASYPDFFISNVIGCSFNKHNVSWEGTLKPTQKKICTYYIEAIRTTTFSAIAKATYLVGILNKTRTAESPIITITIPRIELDFNRSLNSTGLWVGDEFIYNFTIENNIEDYRFENIALDIEAPEGIDFVSYSEGFSIIGKHLRWTGSLDYSEKIDFYVRGMLVRSGNQHLKTNVNYNTGHIVHIEDWHDNITSNIDKLELQYLSFPVKRESGRDVVINVNLKNPSSRYVFKNIKGNITTNFPILFNSFSINELIKKRFNEIIVRNFTAPYVNNPTGYNVDFNISYETEYGEKMMLAEKNTIEITPKGYVAPKKKVDAGSAIVEKIEEVGLKKILLVSIAFIIMFAISITYYFRKAFKKVKDYEQYE